MTASERVAENLNAGLHQVFASDPDVYLLGEDVLDPYGGAFKVTRGLSSRYPDRIITTPISESGIVGVANGLALCGDKVVVEVMFGDFIALAFDQILNFAAKSVSMYGRHIPMHLLIRCTVGGRRGYGPTHSQSPQKHFIGIPHVPLFELSPFHDNRELVARLLALGEPAILFEDKLLYTRRMYTDGVIDDLFGYDRLGAGHVRVRLADGIARPDRADCVIICAGGMADRAIEAARTLFLERELSCQVIVSSRLFPYDVAPLLDVLGRAELICVAEEGVAGGTWGECLAQDIYQGLWGRLRRPVELVSSRPAIIPAAPHLEALVLVQSQTIQQRILAGLHA